MPSAVNSDAIAVARAAAQWLALVESGAATADDHIRLQHWRSSNVHHEQTWQRAQQLRQRFSGLPTELAMAALDRPDLARRTAIKRALGIAALVPATWLLSRQVPLDVWTADLHTAIGEQKTVRLADGSLLQLNTDSAVNVDLGKRAVTVLRGEIALKVPGGAPITLHLPVGRVTLSGSEVCVRLNEQSCQVAVLSGIAQLQPLSGAELFLREGQQASLKAHGASPISTFDASRPSWREGVLLAENQALGDFLRELSRFRPGLLRWEPELENLRVTGSFRLDNTDNVLHLLAATLPVEVQARTRFWVTLVPRKNFA